MSPINPDCPVLLVDDEEIILKALAHALSIKGFTNLTACSRVEAVFARMAGGRVGAVLLDVIMPEMRGEEVLERILEIDPDVPVIMLTGVDDVETAVNCMRRGAYDYLLKPADPRRIADTLHRALERRRLRRENADLSRSFLADEPEKPEIFRGFVTKSPVMHRIFRYVEAVAGSGEPVLITGETGVGKELLARAIHDASGRTGAFVAVNLAGLDDEAFSDTLFGHAKGAFTGAERAREGFMEKAAGGTLFFDEVGDLSLQSQVRLLRVLQEREFHPLGSDTPRPLRARILAAANRNPAELRRTGVLRKDFYYRLASHVVSLPPLRERPEDIAPLAGHFLETAAAAYGRNPPAVGAEVVRLLCGYGFPGNVRELRAMVFDALGRCRGDRLTPAHFPAIRPAEPAPGGDGRENPAARLFAWPVLPTLRQASRALVEEALARSGGNQRQAARLLGITPQALNERLKRAQDMAIKKT